MRSFRQQCAALVLACVFAVSTFAGEMSAGVTSEPPPSVPQTNGEMSAGFTDTVLTLLEGVLSAF